MSGTANCLNGPKILLTGKNGQVGSDLEPLLKKLGIVLATDRTRLDLACPEQIRECVRAFHPTVIINTAAYTAVDRAENEPELAAKINTNGPAVLAEESAKCGALLIHFSTDYVFDGTKVGSYLETDLINPLNVYGRTKADGEEAIVRSGCAHVILRTSWVYSGRGSNFLLTILRLAREREELRIVDDQIGAPTSSAAIAHATMELLRCVLNDMTLIESGIYHLTALGNCSWFGFASEIIRLTADRRQRQPKLVPITSSEYGARAARPLNSRLDCSKIRQKFGIKMPEWHSALSSLITSART